MPLKANLKIEKHGDETGCYFALITQYRRFFLHERAANRSDYSTPGEANGWNQVKKYTSSQGWPGD